MIGLQGQHSQIINFDETLTVQRTGEEAYVDGKIDETKIEKFKIQGNVQPVNGFDLLIVPEGDRFKEQYWLWTETPLRLNRDRILRKDQLGNTIVYQVNQIKPWGSYTQARIIRVDTGPNASEAT